MSLFPPDSSLYYATPVFNVYEAVVVWDETLLTIPLDEADAEPLVGMSLMEGYELKM